MTLLGQAAGVGVEEFLDHLTLLTQRLQLSEVSTDSQAARSATSDPQTIPLVTMDPGPRSWTPGS